MRSRYDFASRHFQGRFVGWGYEDFAAGDIAGTAVTLTKNENGSYVSFHPERVIDSTAVIVQADYPGQGVYTGTTRYFSTKVTIAPADHTGDSITLSGVPHTDWGTCRIYYFYNYEFGAPIGYKLPPRVVAEGLFTEIQNLFVSEEEVIAGYQPLDAQLTDLATISATAAELDAHLALVNEHLDWTGDLGATNIHKNNLADSGNWDIAYGWGDHSAGGYLKADGSVPLTADWAMGAFDLTGGVDATFSGTVQAEQITSTDDITMAGLFYNAPGSADADGIRLYQSAGVGTSSYTGTSTNRAVNIIKAVAGTHEDSEGFSSYGYDNALYFQQILSGDGAYYPNPKNYGNKVYMQVSGAHSATSVIGLAEINTVYDTTLTVGPRTLTSGATTITTFLSKNLLSDTTSYNKSGGTITINNTVGSFIFSATGSVTDGTFTRTNKALYLSGTSNSTGNTTNYGLYIAAVSGGDANWGIYDTSGANGMIEGNLRLGSAVAPTEALHFADAKNIAFDTTTGTKIGTSASQKLAFYNTTPVTQNQLATGAGKTVDQVITELQRLGLVRQAA